MNPSEIAERRRKISVQRALKREQQALEAHKESLMTALAGVNENLEVSTTR